MKPRRSRLRSVFAAALALGFGCGDGAPGGGDTSHADEGSALPDVIFSPQPEDVSHNARIAELIGQATETIDIAIYSFSDAGISDALKEAIGRGVKVRFIFETANAEDKSKTGDDLLKSKSGKLEQIGVNVRFVNKIMHHKFILIDGPVHDADRAATAIAVTGSANWSASAATDFDENTLFAFGNAELNVVLQREFDLMWEHSRDLVVGEPKPFELSTAGTLVADDDPGFEAIMTSSNMTVAEGSTTFKTNKSSMVAANALVAGIERAQESILISSGHLRLRPVAEALIAKRQDDPDIDIRVYLDGQEFISAGGHAQQIENLEQCLADADTDSQKFDCEQRSFLFSKQVGDAGIEVRFKFYAFRWHHSYAPQMHHKYMIVDGQELYTGSYNLSINAEHNTFENLFHFSGAAHRPLVDAFTANFEAIWRTGEDQDLLEQLQEEVLHADPIPIVFAPMALTFDEVTDLKDLIRLECTQINSEEFRMHPEDHKVCPRL